MPRQITDVTKHGAAAGEAARPERADWTIDQGWENYTADEHAVWKTLFERQTKLLPGCACKEFVRGCATGNLLCPGRPRRVTRTRQDRFRPLVQSGRATA